MTRNAKLAELPGISVAGVRLHLVRQALGITAFGANAYSAAAGELLIEPHKETGGNAGVHEELYVVVLGRARFTVDGEEIDAPAGTVVFALPGEHREAVAVEDGTVALVIGGPKGAAGPISAWEREFAAEGETDPGRAYEIVAAGFADHPDSPSLHYQAACHAARAGRREDALRHIERAFTLDPKTREWASDDEDLDPIREDLPS